MSIKKVSQTWTVHAYIDTQQIMYMQDLQCQQNYYQTIVVVSGFESKT